MGKILKIKEHFYNLIWGTNHTKSRFNRLRATLMLKHVTDRVVATDEFSEYSRILGRKNPEDHAKASVNDRVHKLTRKRGINRVMLPK